MDRFVNALAKFAIIIAVIIVAFLFLIIGMLVFAPEVLWTIVRYALIVAGIVAIAYLLWGIVSTLIFLIHSKRNCGNERYIYYQK